MFFFTKGKNSSEIGKKYNDDETAVVIYNFTKTTVKYIIDLILPNLPDVIKDMYL